MSDISANANDGFCRACGSRDPCPTHRVLTPKIKETNKPREFRDSELEKAIRKECLLRDVRVPPKALNALAIAVYEQEINDILHMPDEDEEFARLEQHQRDRIMENTAWLIGRLALAGYWIVPTSQALP